MLKIEQCRKLNISSLDTNDGCSHIAEAECDGQKFPVAYAFDLNDDSRVVNISFQSNNKIQKQTIAIEMVELPLGDKAYFGCDCGKRCSILYQKPDGGVFACRECHKLVYEVKTINKNLMGGVLYKMNRLECLLQKRKKINHIFYDGKPTKKVAQFIHLREKWCV